MLSKSKTQRTLSLLAAFALLLSMLVVGIPVSAGTSYYAPGAIIYDGQAERNLTGYRIWNWNDDSGNSGVSASVDTVNTHNGLSSLKCEATMNSISDVNIENLPGTLKAGTVIKMSVWIKAQDLTNWPAFKMSDTNFAVGTNIGTYDWTYAENTFTIESDITNPKFYYDVQWFTGTVWFQGAKVEVVSVPGFVGGDANVIYDGKAERSLDGYRLWLWNDAAGAEGVSATVDNAVTYNGKSSLKLSASMTSIADVNVDLNGVTLNAGTKIKMSMWVKAQDATNYPMFKLAGTDFWIGTQTGTYDWTYIEGTFTLPSDIANPTFFYDVQWFTGNVWFANAKVEIVNPNVVYDGAAERNLNGYRLWLWNDAAGAEGVSATVDNAVTYNGKSSLKLSASMNSIADVNIENLTGLTLKAGTQIKMSMVVKAENATNYPKFILAGTDYSIGTEYGTYGWTYVEETFTLANDVVNPVFFYDVQWFTGTVWFAGAKVEIVSLPHTHVFEGATCSAPGVCACGEVGTELADHSVVHFDAVEPTCHYNGNIEYWFCSACEGFWADEALTQVTNSKNVIRPALGGEVIHVEAVDATYEQNGNIEYWYCESCEQVWQDEALTQLTNIKNVIRPALEGFVTKGTKTYYYRNGAALKGLQKIGDDFYFFSTGDGNMKKDCDIFVSANDLGLARGAYKVAADGKIQVAKNGLIAIGEKTYYFVNDEMQYGLQKIGDDFYYFHDKAGYMYAGASIWVSANDKGLARGRYNVAEDGKIQVVKKGWVYVGEKTYYYVDDVALKGAQEIDGNYYYFSTGDGNMKKDGAIIWVPADNDGGVPYGKYIAGADGVLTLA